MRSDVCSATSFGWGLIYEKSSVQKPNTKNSTESEVVGFGEYSPCNILINNFSGESRIYHRR